ncbi:MAG: hypothetical protein ACREMN_14630 [Gemmatimonadales bacterium]
MPCGADHPLRFRATGLLLRGALLCAAGCTPPPTLRDLEPKADLTVPTRVGDYRLTERDTIAQEHGGGHVYRFSDGSATRLTVFVYRIPADVQEGPDSAAWVHRESEKFTRVLPIQVERGVYEAYEVAFAHAEPDVRGADTIPGHVVGAGTRRGGEVFVELQYLYLVRGRFVKVRATIPSDRWQETTVPNFAKALVGSIAPR